MCTGQHGRCRSVTDNIKEMLSLPTFLKNSGILGCHCAHQYSDSEVGRYFYPRLPHALKGINAVLFTIFRSLGLAMHIWPVSEGRFSKEDTDTAPRFRDLIIIEEDTEGELNACRVSACQDQHQNSSLANSNAIEIKGQAPPVRWQRYFRECHMV
jgi:hypothetical protein